MDVVLNSLAGEALARGISVLAPYGRFVELGKADIYRNNRLELEPFKRNLSLFAVDLDRMSFEKPDLVGAILRKAVDLLQAGTLTPPPLTVFPMNELADAMRLMAQAKHIGKVVVRVGDDIESRATIPDRPPIHGDATYLITGGLGGLGLFLARWLVDNGARAIVLVGRSQPSLEALAVLDPLRSGGARIEVRACDVTLRHDVRECVSSIAEKGMPALRGIIHAAMVLDDVPLVDLTRQPRQGDGAQDPGCLESAPGDPYTATRFLCILLIDHVPAREPSPDQLCCR